MPFSESLILRSKKIAVAILLDNIIFFCCVPGKIVYCIHITIILRTIHFSKIRAFVLPQKEHSDFRKPEYLRYRRFYRLYERRELYNFTKNNFQRRLIMVRTKDSLYAWLICIVGSLLFFYVFMNINLFSSMGGYFFDKYKMTNARLGMLSAMYFYGSLVMQIPAGYVVDKFSVKRVLQVAFFIGAVAVLALTYSDKLWQIEISRIVAGFICAFGFVTVIRITVNWISPRNHGVAMGTMITFGTLGGIVSQAPMAYLYSLIGGKNTLMCLTALGFIIFILISLFVKAKPKDEAQEEAEADQESYPILQGFIKLLSKKQNWYISFYTGILALSTILFCAVWSSRYLETVFHKTNIEANFISSLILVGTIIGNPLVGFISDKIKSRKKPMIVCVILATIDILAINYCPHLNTTSLGLLYLFLGISIGSLTLGYPYLTESNDIRLAGLVTAIASTLLMGISSFLQPVYGWIVDIVSKGDGAVPGVHTPHAFRVATLILPVCFILAMILISMTKDSLKRSP